MSRCIVLLGAALLIGACAGSDSPASPAPNPRPTSEASLGYSFSLQSTGETQYRASLTLTWRTANGVGFGIESVDVRMHDAQQRLVLREIYDARELASFWGSNRVLALGRESREFATVFTAPVAYVRATVTSPIVDSFDHRRTLELAVTRDGLGTTTVD